VTTRRRRAPTLNEAACALLDRDGFAVQAQPGTTLEQLEDGVGEQVFDIFPYDLEVFMKLAATPAQTRAVETAVGGTSGVASSTFVDRQTAFQEFTTNYADDAEDTTPAEMPESFRIQVTPGTPLETLRDQFESEPRVDTAILAGQLAGEGFNWRIGDADPKTCES
jgi:hypothetical protein